MDVKKLIPRIYKNDYYIFIHWMGYELVLKR